MWRMHYTILRNLILLPKLIRQMHEMSDRPDRYSETEKYEYVRYIVGLMQKTGHIRTEVRGAEYLPKEGGYILYPNHQGKYDAYGIVSAHEKPLTVVMDREMSYFPFVSEIIDVLQGKRMDLRNNRQAARIILQVTEEVAAGRRYIIFPEGGYDDEKRETLWEFKSGCFKAAMRAGVPIVPVALQDSWRVYNSRRILPVKTQVEYLKPILPEEYAGLNTHQVGDLVKSRIQTALDEKKRL